MPLSWVKTKFSDFRSQVLSELATEFEAEVSDDLVEALAAATSLVAFADGVSSPEEREELLAVFEEEDRLTELDLDDLFDAFDDYAERFVEDAKAADSEALAAVAVFDDEPELGRLVVRAALAVGTSDGVLTESEQAAVGRLCETLGIELKELTKPVVRRHDDLDDDDEEIDDDDRDE